MILLRRIQTLFAGATHRLLDQLGRDGFEVTPISEAVARLLDKRIVAAGRRRAVRLA